MELINATQLIAGYTMGIEPSGRELLVVVAKGTFHLPDAGERPSLLEEQAPLIMSDTFTGEPGVSAPIYEVDFAPKKLRCDVLLIGSAYAPNCQPVQRVGVGLKIGTLQKSFAVVGPRVWHSSMRGVRAGKSDQFIKQSISYDTAFGGVDNKHDDATKHAAYMLNPVGKGYHQHLKNEWVEGSPMPSTEQFNAPITDPSKAYAPQSFGPIGRGWQPRSSYAGTYDQHWIDEIFPFLPHDFDDNYYQAAPMDQQTDFLRGGEEVILANLTPTGKKQFQIPENDVPVYFFPRKGSHIEHKAVIDTIVFEPDLKRFSMTWRTHLPLKKSMFEIAQIVVGKKSKAWWRARTLGKDYYSSLDKLPPKKTRGVEIFVP